MSFKHRFDHRDLEAVNASPKRFNNFFFDPQLPMGAQTFEQYLLREIDLFRAL
jgi:hypothetical protein